MGSADGTGSAPIGTFRSAGEYFASHRSDEWRCILCQTTLPAGPEGSPPVTCNEDRGGCRRSREDDANYTYFVPATWSQIKVQSAIDSFTQPGQRLFNEVEANLRRHFYLKETWQYRILALYVLQCKVALGLPAVFYIGIGGPKGSGKTKLQAHIARLARGYVYSNVSIPTLARKMKPGTSVCIDEIDESRGKDYDNVRDALLRDGYSADGPRYERWDYKRNQLDAFSLFGPKLFGYRSGLEDALQSRTFQIPSVKPLAGGENFVFQNLWPEDDGLPDQLDSWGRDSLAEYPPEKLKGFVADPSFREKLKRSVLDVGANRETELSTIGLLVAEMAGVACVEDLRSANEATKSIGDPEPLEQLRITVRSLIRLAREKGDICIDGAVRLRQRTVLENINTYRIQGRQRPLGDKALARWRGELGIDGNMLAHPKNKTTWIIPKPLADAILSSGDDLDEANRLTGGEL